MTLTTYLGAADTARDLLTGPIDGATSPEHHRGRMSPSAG